MSLSITKKIWNQYSRPFTTVTAPCQIELWQEVIDYLNGHVGDFGCGSARLAPLVLDKADVESYTGIDVSGDMVSIAREMSSLWPEKDVHIVQSTIESYAGRKFSSAVSLNSYYVWSDPVSVFSKIIDSLMHGGLFVLATPNPKLDMSKIVAESKKILWGHPDFEEFSELNLKLVEEAGYKPVEMQYLVDELRQSGFALEFCHQSHYYGGMNLIVAKKQ